MTDLAGYQLEHADQDEPPFFNDKNLLKSVVDLTASTDLDIQEKVILDTETDTILKSCSKDLFYFVTNLMCAMPMS